MATRGFQGRRPTSEPKRLPPGQHLTRDFPVLTAGPTPHASLDDWTFTVEDEDGEVFASWGWEAFRALGQTEVTVDIHCVTRWSKLDTRWRGVTVERIFEAAGWRGLEKVTSAFSLTIDDATYCTQCRRWSCLSWPQSRQQPPADLW